MVGFCNDVRRDFAVEIEEVCGGECDWDDGDDFGDGGGVM